MTTLTRKLIAKELYLYRWLLVGVVVAGFIGLLVAPTSEAGFNIGFLLWMTAIIALLLWEPVIPGVSTPLLGTVALWIAAILTLWSMFHYLRLASPHLSEN